jgi:hypothetical protein
MLQRNQSIDIYQITPDPNACTESPVQSPRGSSFNTLPITPNISNPNTCPASQVQSPRESSSNLSSLAQSRRGSSFIISQEQRKRGGSIPELPDIYSSKRSDILASLENSNILSAEPNDKVSVKKSFELPIYRQTISGVEVNKIFDGPKVFFKQKIKNHIIMFEHKYKFSRNLISSTIEIVSYVYEFEKVEVPRIFVSSSKVFPRLRNKMIVKGSHHALESIVSYM